MKVSMLGAGYVGLVSAACFAEFGADVCCIDVDRARIAALQSGQVPIYEPGLTALIAKNVAEGRLSFAVQGQSTGDPAAIGINDLIFIAVGTPTRHSDGQVDLSFIHQAARELAPQLAGYTVVVDKSTVPVGTARQVQGIIRQANPKADFDVAANPEFLREGAAIADFMRPDRVVLGLESARAEGLLRELYRPLNLIEAPILVTSLESAELIKYATNAFLATKISFINEMAALCEALGADVHAVAKGMGLDGRIGRKFLHPGPGYGGSCLPKDTRALAGMGRESGAPSRIVEAVMAVNEAQKARMLTKIRRALGGAAAGDKEGGAGAGSEGDSAAWTPASAGIARPRLEQGTEGSEAGSQAGGEAWIPASAGMTPSGETGAEADGEAGGERGNEPSEKGKNIAVLGLTFKPETDDMRAAPALAILPPLIENGARIQAHDPQGMAAAKSLLPAAVRYFEDLYEAAAGADAIVLLTEWNVYRGLDLARLRKTMQGNIFIDLRNVYEPAMMRRAGFDYHCVGRV